MPCRDCQATGIRLLDRLVLPRDAQRWLEDWRRKNPARVSADCPRCNLPRILRLDPDGGLRCATCDLHLWQERLWQPLVATQIVKRETY